MTRGSFSLSFQCFLRSALIANTAASFVGAGVSALRILQRVMEAANSALPSSAAVHTLAALTPDTPNALQTYDNNGNSAVIGNNNNNNNNNNNGNTSLLTSTDASVFSVSTQALAQQKQHASAVSSLMLVTELCLSASNMLNPFNADSW